MPLRFERMAASPFAFYRGSAAVMAADLRDSPSSGLPVLSCGDAHLANFGLYAAPDRALVFDLNDFDEVASAPAEWDLKRLVTSVVLCGRHNGHPEGATAAAVEDTVRAYQHALRQAVRLSPVERYYRRVEPERAVAASPALRSLIGAEARRARRRTSDRAFRRLVETDAEGRARFRDDPPVLQHVGTSDTRRIERLVRRYLASAAVDVAFLLQQYELLDVAVRVVGVGSVGTRCYVVALAGPRQDPLVLQVKQAGASALQTYGGCEQPPALLGLIRRAGEGGRVVAGQRIMQAASDSFLGSLREGGRDFYVRQLHDMKGSVDLEHLSPTLLSEYASACAVVLAAAHARSPRAQEVTDYLGTGDATRTAIGAWSFAYAEKVLADFEELGRWLASTGRRPGS